MSLFHELLTDPDDSYLVGDCLLEGYNQGANFYLSDCHRTSGSKDLTDTYTEERLLTNHKRRSTVSTHRRTNPRKRN